MIKTAEPLTQNLEKPRFVDGEDLLFAGLNVRYKSNQANANMAERWEHRLP